VYHSTLGSRVIKKKKKQASGEAFGATGVFFFKFVTGPRRSLSLQLSDTRVYEPQTRARLGTTALGVWANKVMEDEEDKEERKTAEAEALLGSSRTGVPVTPA